jgi:hypothetical protein
MMPDRATHFHCLRRIAARRRIVVVTGGATG